MIKIAMFVLLIGIVMGGLSFSKGVKHLLMMLISLEFMVLMVYFISLMNSYVLNQYIGIILLIFSVCEGALGLTLLVSMSRSMGGAYFNSFCLTY